MNKGRNPPTLCRTVLNARRVEVARIASRRETWQMTGVSAPVSLRRTNGFDPASLHARVGVLAWSALAYTGLVILFGAVVRITGSGAGCGQHWPTCQGELLHLPSAAATWIELTHRVTSGLNLLVVGGLALVTRKFSSTSRVRRAALSALLFIGIEALIGAALVVKAWVGLDASFGRVSVMAAHLVNTHFLLAALLWAAVGTARGKGLIRLGVLRRVWLQGRLIRRWSFGAVALLLLSMTGALTALGDTLFPVAGVSEGWAAATSSSPGAGHWLEAWRALHPMLAVMVALYLWRASGLWRGEALGDARWLRCLVALQVAAGTLNIVIGAPGWLQVMHLALALGVWLRWLLLGRHLDQESGHGLGQELGLREIDSGAISV